MSKNLSALAFRAGLEATLFEALGSAAAQAGVVTPEQAHLLAEKHFLGDATVWGAASFYDELKPDHRQCRARVCNGSACLTAGSQPAVRKALEAAGLKADEIGEVACLGRCHENGSFQFAGRNYSHCTAETIGNIVAGKPPAQSLDRYHVGSNLPQPLLTAPALEPAAHYAPLAQLLTTPAEKLLAELQTANLRGRGGAGFPLALKWAGCRAAKGEHKYIICNADEGDPGAYTDRYLLEQQPHLVLFGMLLAGYICGAQWGVVYVRGEYPEACDATEKAIATLVRQGWLGENILGSGFSFRLKLVRGSGAYICGEETALIASLEGARPEVRVRPPYPTEVGLFGRPTVVNNVETFACIRPILVNGGAAFAQIGPPASRGPKLASLDGHFRRPGVYEVAMGTPLQVILNELGGGFTAPIKALQIGGPLGGLVPRSHFDRLTFDFASFKEAGFLLGHGSIVCIPESYPLVDYLAHLFEFTAAESCGKCFPCRIGSVRGAELLRRAIGGQGAMDRRLFGDLLDTLEQGSLCALGGGLPLPIKNALTHFAAELKPYFR